MAFTNDSWLHPPQGVYCRLLMILRLWFRTQKILLHGSSGKQCIEGRSAELGNKCAGQMLIPPLSEAKSSLLGEPGFCLS